MTRSSLLSLISLLGAGLLACSDAVSLVGEEELGTEGSAIVNGIPEAGYPAVGVLVAAGQSGCTATLVGRRTVLTAAHCVLSKNAPYTLQLPVHFYVGGLYGTKYAASSVTTHPSYAGGNQADLAVVRLTQDVAGVTPAVVASSAPQVNEQVTLVGYGLSGENAGQFGTKRRGYNVIASMTWQTLTFNGSSATQGNICNGDSGGPTFALRSGKELLIGVHSTKGGTCGQQGNDMRTDAFHGWISQEAEGDLQGGGAVDQTAPQVQIAKPLAGTSLGTSFSVQVSASDDVGVTRIALYLDAKKVAEASQSALTSQLQNVSAGSHTVEAVAYDAKGRTGSASVTIKVQSGSMLDNGKPFGSSCQKGSECADHVCTAWASGQFCSKACGGSVTCPTGYDCQGGICQAQAGTTPKPPPTSNGAYGASCSVHTDCASGLCAMDNVTGTRFCTSACDLSLDNCPAGSTCQPAGSRAVCGPLHDDAEEDTGLAGCSVGSGAPAAPSAGLLLLGLALLGLARRRRG